MKALNFLEVNKIVEVLNKNLVAGRLQRVYSLPNGIVLEFYNNRINCSVVIEMGKVPFIIFKENKLKLNKIKPKPVEIFLKSHFINSICLNVIQPKANERYLQLLFSEDRYIEVQFAPNAKNISIFSGSKSIHLLKPKLLPTQVGDYQPEFVRSYEEMSLEYEALKRPKVETSPVINNKKPLKVDADIEKHNKKLKAYQAMVEFIDTYIGSWDELFEGSLPKHLTAVWQTDLAVYANYDFAREKVKALSLKLEGAYQQKQKVESSGPSKKNPALDTSVYKSVDVKTRKLELESGAIALAGKSAKDNLLLLRKAKPWFIWMHLRDLPSTHVVITRNKAQKLLNSELVKVAQWLLSQQFKSKNQKKGEKYEVIYTECRYVKPIKGNKSGLVNYQNESTLMVKYESIK